MSLSVVVWTTAAPYSITQQRHKLVYCREFRKSYVTLCTVWTGSVMFQHSWSNYIGSLLSIPYRSNTTSIHTKQSSIPQQRNLSQGKRLSISSARPNKCMRFLSFAVAAPIELDKLCHAIRAQDSVTWFRLQLSTFLFGLDYALP